MNVYIDARTLSNYMMYQWVYMYFSSPCKVFEGQAHSVGIFSISICIAERVFMYLDI